MNKKFLIILSLLLLVSLSLLFYYFYSLDKETETPPEPGTEPTPVADSVGELIPFTKKGLDRIKIYYRPYPTENPTISWVDGDIVWAEGEYIYPKGVGGSQLLKPSSISQDFLRWPGNFSEPHGGHGGLLGTENRLPLILSEGSDIQETPEEHSVIKAKVELNKENSKWRGKILEFETVSDFDGIKNGLVKASEIQEVLDNFVFKKFGRYLKAKTAYRHFDGKNPDIFQKQSCEQYGCVNGLNLWFDKYWDPVNHRLLVKYDWSEDISNRKGCGFKYNVVRSVISVNVRDRKVEAIYLDKDTAKVECPIINK